MLFAGHDIGAGGSGLPVCSVLSFSTLGALEGLGAVEDVRCWVWTRAKEETEIQKYASNDRELVEGELIIRFLAIRSQIQFST
jgi:hypothetical protein